jgi:5-methyltetrahydrofolate--homocysteine methyltransferase
MKSFFSDKEILVMDGAMGTQLIAHGLPQGHPSILWNVERPALVFCVHESYADAGADWLTTNTFGGSTLMLNRSGLGDRLRELNLSAVDLARKAARGRCRVLGDIGPCGGFLEPLGELTEVELAEAVDAQAWILADAGVDGFVVETMSDPNEMRVTVAAVKRYGLPIIASYTYEHAAGGCRTMMGVRPYDASRTALEAGADIVGANCGTSLSLDDYLLLGQELVDAAEGVPVMLQPNAGTPVATDGGLSYRVSPTDFAAWAQCATTLGVRIIGGCCGTRPAHIAAAAHAVKKAARPK